MVDREEQDSTDVLEAPRGQPAGKKVVWMQGQRNSTWRNQKEWLDSEPWRRMETRAIHRTKNS